jgi:hypothetical protein
MTTASAIRQSAAQFSAAAAQTPTSPSRAPRCISARERDFATCHLAGSSTLIPRGLTPQGLMPKRV